MKILLSAFECNPYLGSDPYVGWAWVENMSLINEVYVLLRIDHKRYIEQYQRENTEIMWNNINFIYIDTSRLFGKFVYKFNKQLAVVGQYFLWQKSAYKIAKKLHKEIGFDIAHVVSMADYRFPGYLWKLNIPYVFGPVGGAQETPKCLLDYVKGHEKNEKFRLLMNRLLTRVPNYGKALKKAEYVFCSNYETEECIRKIVSKNNVKICRMTELGINQAYLNKRVNISHKNKDLVKVMVSGRLIYRKGIELLVDSVAKMKTKKNYEISIYGQGDQLTFLKKKVEEYNLTDKIVFYGNISFEEMQKEYINHDIFCLPSLRETTGTAVFEAMANKLPVVALNQNGVKDVVEDDCGILVDIFTKEQIVKDYALALDYYTWDKKIEGMNKIYMELIDKYAGEI